MRIHKIMLFVGLAFASVAVLSQGLTSTSPANAEVYFIQPIDGAVLKGPVRVVFGLKNMGVSPAGVNKENTGHHHLLIDVDVLPDLTAPLPVSDNVEHFGGGQTEAEIVLAPGKHTLQLVLGNYVHVPHDKPVLSEKITIIVE